MKKKIGLFLVLAIMLIIPIDRAKATTLQDLYNKLSELQEKQSDAASNKKLTTSEMNALNDEINALNSNIEKTKNSITEAQNSIEDSYKKIDEKKEETNELLKFLQVSSGENVYLEYLFDAEDYTDFIYRYSIVTQLSDYNQNLMNELETLITELEQKKIDLAEKQTSLEGQAGTLNSKMNTLRANLSELTELGTTIEQDIADLKKDIDYYENTLGCSRNQDITTCASTPYAHGWTYPMAYGCVTSEYQPFRTDWNYGSSHYGIDLSCIPEGSKVYPAASGTVARVVYHSTCGGNMVYVYHTVNGVAYTTVYMHLKSYNVSVGQVVSESTVIGYMGGYSYGYDGCTTGPHLHFGMASGHNAYNFNSYAFNPRNIYVFPSEGYGYFYR